MVANTFNLLFTSFLDKVIAFARHFNTGTVHAIEVHHLTSAPHQDQILLYEETPDMLKFLLLCAISLPAMAAEHTQSAASYEAAIRGSFETVTSAPAYVMVTIGDANTGLERKTCTTANLLAGAIDLEYALTHDDAGRKQALALALSNTSHRFVFTKQAALNNVSIEFTPQDLQDVRTWLAPVSNQDLMAGAHPWTSRDTPYSGRGYRSAVACVLIERGLSPYMADITGQVVVGGSKDIPVKLPALGPSHP